MGFKQQGRDAELGQHAAIGPRVFGGLEGHARQGLRRGHRRHGQRKAAQVVVQRPGMGAGVEPGGQAACIGCRAGDAALAQQVEQGGHAQAAVQVLVQQHLRAGAGQAEQMGVEPGLRLQRRGVRRGGARIGRGCGADIARC
jgi:hypothetical protein